MLTRDGPATEEIEESDLVKALDTIVLEFDSMFFIGGLEDGSSGGNSIGVGV